MTIEEQQALLTEAGPAMPEGQQQPKQTVIEPQPDAQMAQAIGGAVGILGNIVCTRANVTCLEPQESEALGQSLAYLLAIYYPGPKDPKLAAWFGLAIVSGSVIANRKPLAPKVPPAPVIKSEGVTEDGTVYRQTHVDGLAITPMKAG